MEECTGSLEERFLFPEVQLGRKPYKGTVREIDSVTLWFLFCTKIILVHLMK